MGYKSLRTLSDCAKHRALLHVECGCRRAKWKSPHEFMKPPPGVRAVPGHTRIDELAAMLRCNCGRKGMRVLISTDYRVPAGVPTVEFLNADDRQRKRMIRIARG